MLSTYTKQLQLVASTSLDVSLCLPGHNSKHRPGRPRNRYRS